MKTYDFVSRVFTVIGQELTRTCTADLLIDLPEAVEKLENGEDVHVLSRKTGSDLYDKYVCILKDKMPENYIPTEAEVYDKVNHSLGYAIETIIHPDFRVELKFNDTFKKTDERCDHWREVNHAGLWNFFRSNLLNPDEIKHELVVSRDTIEFMARYMRSWKIDATILN
jgi:hypothetical protein